MHMHIQIKPKPGHTTKMWVWDYRREEMDADSPFHSTQRVTRGVSGKFGRHGKRILTLDENIKWQDGWTNWHAVFTISKNKGQPVFGEVTSNSLCTSKVHTQSAIDVSQYIITQTKIEPDHLSIQKLLCLETSGLHFHQAIQINFYVTMKIDYDCNKIL